MKRQRTNTIVEIARAEERAAAFRLVFCNLKEEDQNERVTNALKLVNEGELDPEGIFVVRRGKELAGTLVGLPLRGSGGLLWPPFVRKGPRQELLEDQLVQTALNWLRARGAKLAQALLSAAEVHLAPPLERNGFQHITTLEYLRHSLEETDEQEPPPTLSCQTFSQADLKIFQETLLRTYEGTQDCPELNGVRTIEEILDGHMAQGKFHPDRWWLAHESGQPVGVMLVTEIAEWQSWDLSYVGIVPEARGRGLGRALTRMALRGARAAGAKQFTLAVDARNVPARNLYLGLGFEPWDQREAYLTFFPPPTG